MKIDKKKPLHWLILIQQGLYTLIAICARYVTPRPEKPLAVLYGHQLSGNLRALYEQWCLTHRDQFDMYFLSLDPAYPAVQEQEDVKVLRCNRLRDMIKTGRCSAMITDHGLHAMQPFIHLTDIIFIDVWHGIPFKGFVPDDFKVQHRYDEVWVSSPLLKQIYEEKFGFRPEIVHDMGYARADTLFRNDPPDPTFRVKADIPGDHKIVLYAPTWQQDDRGRELFPFGESQESFVGALSMICEKHGATLVIRSHLNARIGKQDFANVRYCPMSDFPDTEGLLLNVDILICDWSSIAFDYLALNRPAIFLDVEPPFKNGFSLGKEFRYGKVAKEMRSLLGFIDSLLESTKPYFLERNTFYQDTIESVYGAHRNGRASQNQIERLSGLIAV